MFDTGMLSVGKLHEILDDKGTTAYPLRYKSLDSGIYEVEMSITRVDRPMLHDHTAWVIPILSAFDPSRLDSLKNGWILKKVLLAVNEIASPETIAMDPSGPYNLKYAYPVLKGCAKQIPLDEEERFLCDIHGIKYD